MMRPLERNGQKRLNLDNWKNSIRGKSLFQVYRPKAAGAKEEEEGDDDDDDDDDDGHENVYFEECHTDDDDWKVRSRTVCEPVSLLVSAYWRENFSVTVWRVLWHILFSVKKFDAWRVFWRVFCKFGDVW